MDRSQASRELARLRADEGATLGDIAALVDRARPGLDQAATTDFMLAICGLLESRDFGDYEGQPRLLTRYAGQLLDTPGLDVAQQLLLLTHLEHDVRPGEQDWPRLREQRAQQWLRALRQAVQEAGPEPTATPVLSVPLPPAAGGLPHGVAPEAVTDDAARAEYENAVRLNSQLSAQVAQHHRMRRLLTEYQPHAMTYVARSFSQPPQDQARMRQLMDEIGSLAL